MVHSLGNGEQNLTGQHKDRARDRDPERNPPRPAESSRVKAGSHKGYGAENEACTKDALVPALANSSLAGSFDNEVRTSPFQHVTQRSAHQRDDHIEQSLAVEKLPGAEKDEAGIQKDPHLVSYDRLQFGHFTLPFAGPLNEMLSDCRWQDKLGRIHQPKDQR